MPVAVRLALPDDLSFFASVEARAAERFDADDLPAALRGRTIPVESLRASQLAGLAWSAVDGLGQVVGFLVARKVPWGIHINEMSVLPSHGGAGAGTALLTAATDSARRAGYAQVTLTTFSHIAWNGPFYLHRGFRILGPEECPPELLQCLETEAGAGLRNRVAMSRDLT